MKAWFLVEQKRYAHFYLTQKLGVNFAIQYLSGCILYTKLSSSGYVSFTRSCDTAVYEL